MTPAEFNREYDADFSGTTKPPFEFERSCNCEHCLNVHPVHRYVLVRQARMRMKDNAGRDAGLGPLIELVWLGGAWRKVTDSYAGPKLLESQIRFEDEMPADSGF